VVAVQVHERERPARRVAPGGDVVARHGLVAPGRHGGEGAAERRARRVAVGLVDLEVGAQRGQEERQQIRLREQRRRKAAQVLELGHEALVGQRVERRAAGRDVGRAAGDREEVHGRRVARGQAPRELERDERAEAVAEQRVRGVELRCERALEAVDERLHRA
jgi:hypothetical protein